LLPTFDVAAVACHNFIAAAGQFYVLWANYREERLEKIRDGIEEVDQVL